jgi:hypothetical protein
LKEWLEAMCADRGRNLGNNRPELRNDAEQPTHFTALREIAQSVSDSLIAHATRGGDVKSSLDILADTMAEYNKQGASLLILEVLGSTKTESISLPQQDICMDLVRSKIVEHAKGFLEDLDQDVRAASVRLIHKTGLKDSTVLDIALDLLRECDKGSPVVQQALRILSSQGVTSVSDEDVGVIALYLDRSLRLSTRVVAAMNLGMIGPRARGAAKELFNLAFDACLQEEDGMAQHVVHALFRVVPELGDPTSYIFDGGKALWNDLGVEWNRDDMQEILAYIRGIAASN